MPSSVTTRSGPRRLGGAAGVNLPNVGIFGWALLEPEPDRYDVGWLDDVLDDLGEAAIHVALATATASPPPWMAQRWPETLPMTREGRRLWPGGRQAWCPSSPVCRERSLQLAERIATRYAGHPALTLWHVSNELGCHNARCYCDVSAAALRGWLRARYRDIDAINEAWGTAFWSQRYHDGERILPPREVPAFADPTQQLDVARFSSDELLGQYRAERDVLPRIAPGVALMFDRDSRWSVELDARPSVDVRYQDRATALHAALWLAGVTTDVVPASGSDLARYRLVVVPTLYLAAAAALRRQVAAGGPC